MLKNIRYFMNTHSYIKNCRLYHNNVIDHYERPKKCW